MLDDTFRRSGRLILDTEGDLWIADEWGDRDYAGHISEGLTSYEVEPEELPIVALWKADFADASRDLRGEARHTYYSGRGL